MLEFASYAEVYSSHPIAVSILKSYGKEIDKDEVLDYDEIAGYGLKVKVKGKEIIAGNIKLMDKENIYESVDSLGTVIHVAVDSKYVGYILIFRYSNK